MRNGRQLAALLAAVSVLLAAGAPARSAIRVKTLAPAKFVSRNAQNAWREPAFVSSSNLATSSYYVPLKLPPGSRIVRVVGYLRHLSGTSTEILLVRVKTGHDEESLSQFDIANFDPAMGGVQMDEAASPAPHRVERGYKYYFVVACANSSSRVYAIKVYYRPPQ